MPSGVWHVCVQLELGGTCAESTPSGHMEARAFSFVPWLEVFVCLFITPPVRVLSCMHASPQLLCYQSHCTPKKHPRWSTRVNIFARPPAVLGEGEAKFPICWHQADCRGMTGPWRSHKHVHVAYYLSQAEPSQQ